VVLLKCILLIVLECLNHEYMYLIRYFFWLGRSNKQLILQDESHIPSWENNPAF